MIFFHIISFPMFLSSASHPLSHFEWQELCACVFWHSRWYLWLSTWSRLLRDSSCCWQFLLQATLPWSGCNYSCHNPLLTGPDRARHSTGVAQKAHTANLASRGIWRGQKKYFNCSFHLQGNLPHPRNLRVLPWTPLKVNMETRSNSGESRQMPSRTEYHRWKGPLKLHTINAHRTAIKLSCSNRPGPIAPSPAFNVCQVHCPNPKGDINSWEFSKWVPEPTAPGSPEAVHPLHVHTLHSPRLLPQSLSQELPVPAAKFYFLWILLAN